jgi:hypothetical protein
MTNSLTAKLASKSSRNPSTKQVRLKLVYIDFWSVVKLAFLVAIALAIIMIVGTFLLYIVVYQTGVFGQVNKLVADVVDKKDGNFDLGSVLSLPQVMGFTVIVALLNTVIITALGAVTAILYNLSVKITGGLLIGFTNN